MQFPRGGNADFILEAVKRARHPDEVRRRKTEQLAQAMIPAQKRGLIVRYDCI
jgi:hypothetical protein